jgi:hypothetical protein
LIANTVVGTIWFVRIKKENADFLKTHYYVEGVILLSIPITIASIFIILIIVGLLIFIVEQRRTSRLHRFDDEEIRDEE